MTQNNPLVEGQEWVIASERRERGNLTHLVTPHG